MLHVLAAATHTAAIIPADCCLIIKYYIMKFIDEWAGVVPPKHPQLPVSTECLYTKKFHNKDKNLMTEYERI